MTVEIKDQLLFKYSDHVVIDAETASIDRIQVTTTAALQFYSNETNRWRTFNAIEKENDSFRNAVRNLRGHHVTNHSVNHGKSIKSIWESKCAESPLYERDCIHGRNCHEINGCNCTSWKQVAENETKRLAQKKKKRSGGTS